MGSSPAEVAGEVGDSAARPAFNIDKLPQPKALGEHSILGSQLIGLIPFGNIESGKQGTNPDISPTWNCGKRAKCCAGPLSPGKFRCRIETRPSCASRPRFPWANQCSP